MLTRLAMLSFLESVFAADPARRAQMESFLTRELAQEQASVLLSMSTVMLNR